MKLEEARNIARFTQDSVAGILGISRATYAKMEKNPEIITIEEAKKLAALFNTPVEDIFFKEKL